MAEKLFWAVFEHLGQLSPRFRQWRRPKAFCPQVQAPDSSGGFDHYSADCFLYGLGPTSAAQGGGQVSSAAGFAKFSARFAIVDTARHNDARRAREMCAGIKAGEIVIFDKAYVDFEHLADLSMREVFWVTRAKDNMQFQVVQSYQQGMAGKFCGMI